MIRFSLDSRTSLCVESLMIILFDYILSKQLNKKLFIFVNDEEKQAETNSKENLEILNLFSIDYEQVIYKSANLKYHRQMAMKLLTQGKAFSCFCSSEKLEELQVDARIQNKTYKYDDFCANLSDETVLNVNAPFVVRIKLSKNEELEKSNKDFDFSSIDSFIILNQDKTPTQNYACSVDDMLYDISLVVHNETSLENISKQIYVRNSLGYDKEIKYIKVPKVTNAKKVKELLDDGFLPAAIANYLVLLGSKTSKEIFSLEEAINWFKIENIFKDELEFDCEKLKSINRKYLEDTDDLRLSKLLGFADIDIGKLGKFYLKECSTIKEIKSKIDKIFAQKNETKEYLGELKLIKTCLLSAPYFEGFLDFKEYVKKETKIEENVLFKLLAYILTGEKDDSNLIEIYPFIKNYIQELIR